jgi:FAD/FMN-containing dehydrogenase
MSDPLPPRRLDPTAMVIITIDPTRPGSPARSARPPCAACPRDDARCIGWAREFFDATRPYASSTAYVNFLSEEDGERLSSTYGSNYGRLREIKAKYDPENVFRVNQNIKP